MTLLPMNQLYQPVNQLLWKDKINTEINASLVSIYWLLRHSIILKWSAKKITDAWRVIATSSMAMLKYPDPDPR